MATLVAAEAHQATQEELLLLLPELVAEAWSLLDPHDLRASLPAFVVAIESIIRDFGRAASAAAIEFYTEQRVAAGIVSRFSPSPSSNLTEEAVRTAVEYATSVLYGPVTDETLRTAEDLVTANASNLVLSQSRETILDAVRQDRAAKGWARVTEPDACSFCTMLALRSGAGFLYKRESTSDFRAHVPHLKGGSLVGGVCRCHVVPVFTAYEPPHRLREAASLWTTATSGLGGNDARNAFRRAWSDQPNT